MQETTEKPRSYKALGLAGKTSYTVVLPRKMVDEIGMEKGDWIRVTRDDRRLILEKA